MTEGLQLLQQDLTWNFESTLFYNYPLFRRRRLITLADARQTQLKIDGTHRNEDFDFNLDSSTLTLRNHKFNMQTILDNWSVDSRLEVVHINIERPAWEGHRVELGMGLLHRLNFDMSLLEKFAVYKKMKRSGVTLFERYEGKHSPLTLHERWEEVIPQPGFDPERCYMEALLREVSRIGKIIIAGGTEAVMPFEEYWAQYEERKEGEKWPCWTYVIER